MKSDHLLSLSKSISKQIQLKGEFIYCVLCFVSCVIFVSFLWTPSKSYRCCRVRQRLKQLGTIILSRRTIRCWPLVGKLARELEYQLSDKPRLEAWELCENLRSTVSNRSYLFFDSDQTSEQLRSLPSEPTESRFPETSFGSSRSENSTAIPDNNSKPTAFEVLSPFDKFRVSFVNSISGQY